jgi:hypothetical protein
VTVTEINDQDVCGLRKQTSRSISSILLIIGQKSD